MIKSAEPILACKKGAPDIWPVLLLIFLEVKLMSEQKTNAMRMLDKAKIDYKVYTYEHKDGGKAGTGR